MIETAYAKLNLALHVRARRADGYHELETLFAFAEDGDLLELLDCDSGEARPSLQVAGPLAADIAGEISDNLIVRAAAAFAEAFGDTRTTAFRLDKRLPVAAGIGGGSADAAAALRLCARRAAMPVDEPALLRVAATLGADVPACMLSRTVRGEGKGERLLPVEGGDVAGLPVLLVNPRVAMPTGPVFKGWDGIDRGPLARAAAFAAARAGRNDLEGPACALAPEIAQVLALLATQPGATLVRMSGSGATCFALFDDVATRDRAAASIAAARPDWWQLASRLRS